MSHSAKPCIKCTEPPRLVRRGVYYELICQHHNMVDMSMHKLVKSWNKSVEGIVK